MNKGLIKAVLIFYSISSNVCAQSVFFKDADENAISKNNTYRIIVPEKYRTTFLNTNELKNFLWSLPAEQNIVNRKNAPILLLPMPDGKMARFHVWEYKMMEPALAEIFPEIKTFVGQGIDDPNAIVRFDYNPYFGFSAQIFSINGNVYIDPYARGDINHCISYFSKDYRRDYPFKCRTFTDSSFQEHTEKIARGQCRGSNIYTFRLAVACTGEYAIAVCSPAAPSTAATMAAITTTVNRVNGIYEKELAMRFILVGNNSQIVFLNPATDPYTNGNAFLMQIENQTTLNNVIGTANYDAGIVFGTGDMSMTVTFSFCSWSNKGKAVCGLPNPVGDLFDVNRVCHNLGHVFGAPDTYNSNDAICMEGPSIGGWEPGSGTTIMAATGTCGPDNLQPQPDPFFHTESFDAITQFTPSCGVMIPNGGNRPPRIIFMPVIGYNIPQGTPFTFNAVAMDDDGDPITYCWETTNRGPVGAWNSGNLNGSPFFKSRAPKTSGSRTFPDMNVILAGYPANPLPVQGGLKGETLPVTTAGIGIRLTIRDNRGGVINDQADCHNALFPLGVYTVPGTGPFKVNLPDGGETWSAGSQQTILWDVAGTTGAMINTQMVNILLSTDGGFTYPFLLAASVPNDGFEVLTMPNISTTTARIKVEAVQNIFFDISNANFSIAPAPVGFEFGNPNIQTVNCPAPATVTYSLGTISNGGYNTPIALSASGVPAGASISFGTNPVQPGNSSIVTLNNVNTVSQGVYYITVTGTSGVITRARVLVLNLQTGPNPVITTQPVSQTDCEGSNVTFTIASPSAISYQWQISTDGGFVFNNITPNGNSSSYTISGITFQHNNYRYRCIVTGQCNNTISNVVRVNVWNAALITAHPQNVSACAGSSKTFSVSVFSGAPSYQWQVNTNNGAGFTNIIGATSDILALFSVTTGMNNNQYRCLVYNPNCFTPTVSNSATLTVNELPVVTINAAPYTKLFPGLETIITATGSASAGALPFSFRWFLNGAQLGGVTGNTYKAGISRLGNYRVDIVDARGCVSQSNILNIGDSVTNRLFIFPNPANTSVEFAFHNPGGLQVNWQITIYNATGGKVFYDRIFNSGTYPKMVENVSRFTKGVYFVVLSDNSGKVLANGKLIVH
jgi:hypothetical protein